MLVYLDKRIRKAARKTQYDRVYFADILQENCVKPRNPWPRRHLAELWPSLQPRRIPKSRVGEFVREKCCFARTISLVFAKTHTFSGDRHATRLYSSQCSTSTTYEKSADKQWADFIVWWFAVKQRQKHLEMADCVTRVELHLSCRGLLDKDTTSKSDPLCAMYIQDAHGKWVEVGVLRTWLTT